MAGQGCTTCGRLVAMLWENGERRRKWRGIRKWREIQCPHFFIFSLFPPSLSISYIKNCLILLQNVEYSTFVANVTKNVTYVLWENNSGSNLPRESSASFAGLPSKMIFILYTVFPTSREQGNMMRLCTRWLEAVFLALKMGGGWQ